MDQYLSTVIIALITGVFSVITLIIQKKQDKVINKIDEKTLFIDREKNIKKKLNAKQEEKEGLMQEMMILILDSNIELIKNVDASNDIKESLEVYIKYAEDLKSRLSNIKNDIEAINKEYSMMLELTAEAMKEISAQQKD